MPERDGYRVPRLRNVPPHFVHAAQRGALLAREGPVPAGCAAVRQRDGDDRTCRGSEERARPTSAFGHQRVFGSGRFGVVKFVGPCGESVNVLPKEHCPNCGGEIKTIASILEQPVIEKILTHLGLQARAPPRAPARCQTLQAA